MKREETKSHSSYEKMPKRLVVYKKVFNTKILALVSAAVKTGKKNSVPKWFPEF